MLPSMRKREVTSVKYFTGEEKQTDDKHVKRFLILDNKENAN